ncbi:MAG: M4 family metallopeptidase [Anaerolineales bacterium]
MKTAKQLVSILFILSLLVAQFPASAQGSLPAVADSSQLVSPEVLEAAFRLQDEGVRISFHAQTGLVSFLAAQEGLSIQRLPSMSAGDSPEGLGRGYLAAYGSLFGLTGNAKQLRAMRQSSGENGLRGIHFQQLNNGIPVLGGELIVQMDAGGNLLSINGEILPNITVSTTPSLNASAAKNIALDLAAGQYEVAASALSASEPELWIYNPVLTSDVAGKTSLVWRTEITHEFAPIRELVLVDAQSGAIVLNFNQVDTARNRLTYTCNNSGTCSAPVLVCNEADPTCAAGDADAKAAHKYAGETYDFYKAYHNRDSINNAGMSLISRVHYSSGYCNAFWNGSSMTYGDGCSSSIVVDDVVAHELTHGVTQYESNLVYSYQSGAINESLSDVWGEFVDLTNSSGNDAAAVKWLMGEDIVGTGPFRSMKNPPAYGDPDRMGSPLYYKGTGDNGGVHTNSGVGNKAAFLITDGGTFNGQTIVGLGITKTAKIFYRVQTALLTSSSNYADLGNALYQACINLVGTSGITTANCANVRKATIATQMVKDSSKPVPLKPAGTITDKTPTFVWTKATGASQYQVQLLKGTKVIYTFIAGAATCKGSNCSKTPAKALALGTYKWRVRPAIGGWKAWSAWKVFKLAAPAAGFNSPFTSNAAGWAKVSGAWALKGGSYTSNGLPYKWASIVHSNNYPTLTYSVKMKRTGSEYSLANAVWFRGKATPLDSANHWHNGYYFAYSNTGHFLIGYYKSGSFYALLPWTYSSRISQNGWNTLKVTANGSYVQFFINGTRVAYGTVSVFSTGQVGLGFYRNSPAGSLAVDWATLAMTAPKSIAGSQGFNFNESAVYQGVDPSGFTLSPTETPVPTATPTLTPTPTEVVPTDTPTAPPTEVPSDTPSDIPSDTPTDTPPSETPTEPPVDTPTDSPTEPPAETPTETPTPS